MPYAVHPTVICGSYLDRMRKTPTINTGGRQAKKRTLRRRISAWETSP